MKRATKNSKKQRKILLRKLKLIAFLSLTLTSFSKGMVEPPKKNEISNHSSPYIYQNDFITNRFKNLLDISHGIDMKILSNSDGISTKKFSTLLHTIPLGKKFKCSGFEKNRIFSHYF